MMRLSQHWKTRSGSDRIGHAYFYSAVQEVLVNEYYEAFAKRQSRASCGWAPRGSAHPAAIAEGSRSMNVVEIDAVSTTASIIFR